MHKKHIFALPVLELFTFVDFYTLNIVWNITLKLQAISARNSVGDYISLSMSEMHNQRITGLPFFSYCPLFFSL